MRNERLGLKVSALTCFNFPKGSLASLSKNEEWTFSVRAGAVTAVDLENADDDPDDEATDERRNSSLLVLLLLPPPPTLLARAECRSLLLLFFSKLNLKLAVVSAASCLSSNCENCVDDIHISPVAVPATAAVVVVAVAKFPSESYSWEERWG